MQKITYHFLLSLALIFSLSSCVTEKVTETRPGMKFSEAAVISVQDPNVSIEKGATFAWLPEAIQYYKDERLANAPVKPLIEQEIVGNLQARGMKLQASVRQSDFAIAYTAALESSLDDYAIIRQFGLLPGNSRIPADDRSIEKGSLIVYVFDNSSKDIVWRAAAQVGVRFDTPMDERRQRVKQVIAEMFLTFPLKE